MLLESIFVVIFGLCFGSFVTLVSYRLPRNEDVLIKPSRCIACNKKLKFLDLFPVLSWLWFGAKCSGCKVSISARYPLTELAQAILFLWVYWHFGLSTQAIILMLASVVVMVMIVVDFECYILPDSAQIALGVLGIAYSYVVEKSFWSVLSGAVIGLSIGLLLCYGYKWAKKKEGLGFGDVKLLAVAGIWLSPMYFPPFLFYSGVLGILTGLGWRAFGKGNIFPFGPALLLAMFTLIIEPVAYEIFWRQFNH